MIIRCPECSTGFKLPDERLSEDPIKVRCSKCKEVFRVGLVDGDAVRYDVDGNRIDEDESDDANQTQFGSPGAAVGGDQPDDADEDSDQAAAEQSDAGDQDEPVEQETARNERDTQRGRPATAADADDDEEADGAEMKAGDPDPKEGADEEQQEDESGRKETLMGTPAAQPADEDGQQQAEESSQGEQEQADEQAASPSPGKSQSSSPDYDPFPHADTGGSDDADDASDQQESVGGLSQASSDAIDSESDDADQDDDPFADVLDEQEAAEDSGESPEPSGGDDKPTDDERAAESTEESDSDVKSTKIGLGGQQPQSGTATSGTTTSDDEDTADEAADNEELSDLEVGDDIPTDDDSINQQQRDRAQSRSAQSGGGSSAGVSGTGGTDAATEGDEFEEDREFFDPDKGRVGPDGSPSDAADAGGPDPGLAESSAPAGPPQGGGPPGQGPPDSQQSQPQQAQSQPEQQQTGGGAPAQPQQEQDLETVSTAEETASRAASPSEPPETDWDVGGADRLDEAAYSSGWFQSFANVLLIALILAGMLVTVAAIRAGGVIDFSRMSHMMQVTLHGDKFQPRDAWKQKETPVKTGSPSELEFTNVVAEVIERKADKKQNGNTSDDKGESDQKQKILVVRGQAKNVADDPVKGLEIRVLIYDKNEKRIAEAKSPVGTAISTKDLATAKSLDELELDSDPVAIAPQEAEPFTVVFRSPPKQAVDGSLISYGVERVE